MIRCVLSHSVVSNSLQHFGLQLTRILFHGIFRQEYWSGLAGGCIHIESQRRQVDCSGSLEDSLGVLSVSSVQETIISFYNRFQKAQEQQHGLNVCLGEESETSFFYRAKQFNPSQQSQMFQNCVSLLKQLVRLQTHYI